MQSGIPRLLSDNGSCYRSRVFKQETAALGLKHRFTRPYTPKTNGKAERFIQTSLREWAYAFAYPSSARRAARLPAFLHNYNFHRPHHSLNLNPPVSRLRLDVNNLLTLHTWGVWTLFILASKSVFLAQNGLPPGAEFQCTALQNAIFGLENPLFIHQKQSC